MTEVTYCPFCTFCLTSRTAVRNVGEKGRGAVKTVGLGVT